MVASNIAANVASATNLSVAPSVASLAISTQIESTLPATDDSTINKPQIIEVGTNARQGVVTHTVKAGDTVPSLAEKYGISSNTIKWANDLTTDGLTVGTKLKILPQNGVLHKVSGGDTVTSIASKYKANASLITTFNNLEITGLTSGKTIVVPGGVLPTAERPGYVAPTTSSVVRTSYASSFASGSVGNRYALGNCTWYAYERRAQMGKPVGSFWGNANTWASAAGSLGYSVNNRPSVGAVLVDTAAGYFGHVGVVESVLSNGDIVITEMNNAAYGGFNIVNDRTISAGQAGLYLYVH